ncbi:MAG: sodium ion-translocating decarboxylase subunit beta, partial [Oscillospiraceae bacterium]
MNILDVFRETIANSGFAALTWQQGVMMLVAFALLYMAIVKKFEPLLLLPIAFGMLLANLPSTGIMADPAGIMDASQLVAGAHWYDSGVLRLIYAGVKSSIFPCLIFLGV